MKKKILKEFREIRLKNKVKRIWKEKHGRYGINIEEWLDKSLDTIREETLKECEEKMLDERLDRKEEQIAMEMRIDENE